MGAFGPLVVMILVTFQATLFGSWVVKLSYNQDDELFLLIAHNVHNKKVLIQTFSTEMEVISFVDFLGEKYE